MKYLLILLFFTPISWLQAQTAISVVDQMLSGCDKVKTLTYTLKKWERINGKLEFGHLDCRFQRNPFKVYMYVHVPNKGAEVLYVPAEMGRTALVNPNAFPYVNLNLDVDGSLLRDKQHHNSLTSGFDYFASLIKNAKVKFASDIDKALTLEGSVTWNGKSCYKLVLANPRYGVINYTMGPNETVYQAAMKNFVSEYQIIEMNSNIVDDPMDKAPGKTIKIPSDYGKRIVLYIDKTNYLPIVQFVYDDKGLYEQYEFHNLVVNPTFPATEFTKAHKGYHY